MPASDEPLGCSGLLRVAGLPVRYWLEGANSALFGKVARLERDETLRRSSARDLAARIGEQFVPRPDLSREDRAFLLNLRRKLHRGESVARVSVENVCGVPGLIEADANLVRALLSMIDQDRRLAAARADVEADLTREQERLLLLCDQIRYESQVARAVLLAQAPGKPALGPHLSQKSRRQRTEHQWDRIARAATGSTPRGWLSHVALVLIDPAAESPVGVDARFTVQWMENVRRQGVALTDPPPDWPSPESRLALNPLRWEADGCLTCVILDQTRDHSQATVRRTALVDAICAVLGDKTRTFEELAQAIGYSDQNELLTLRGFVRHLTVLGILQSSAPPQTRREQLSLSDQPVVGLPGTAPGDDTGWVDVYRHAERAVPASLAQDLQAGVALAVRILRLATQDPIGSPQLIATLPEQSWSLSEIMASELGSGAWSTRERPEHVTDPVASQAAPPESGLNSLIQAITEYAGNTDEVVISSSLLDACGAPDGPLTWPIDCLLRVPGPAAGFTAVLDQISPPGTLDARFVDTLGDLHGPVPHVQAYRDFLRRVEDLTGILFVEMLMPPLQDGAANAVRRPVYTSAWTGDPHTAAYLHHGENLSRYIPLHQIQIRRVDGRLRAHLNGQPLCPVYHATRSFSPPWDRLAHLLLAASPLDLPWDFKHVIRSLTRFPGQEAAPRVSVSGGLILSPARWRVPCDHLWESDEPLIAKVRALIRLRERHALPRWVYLNRGETVPPVPCDLESVHTIRTIQRWTAGAASATFIEMLPTPEHFPVLDRAHHNADRLAAQLHLRCPCDESATHMAARVAPVLLAHLGPNAAGPRQPAAGSRARGPPARDRRFAWNVQAPH